MATQGDSIEKSRLPLTRERVLLAAVAFADEHGIEALSMRKLGQELSVEAMSLYNHVPNKKEILSGMVDLVIGEINTPTTGDDWKASMRALSTDAREAMLRHPWAPGMIENQVQMSKTMLTYIDSILGIFAMGGFTPELTHHAMHAIGSRLMGFTQEMFESDNPGPEAAAVMSQRVAAGTYPHLLAMMSAVDGDGESITGGGCDSQAEFEFGLDLLLDGLDRLLKQA